jgi:uncharacterized membrane protein YgcG
VRRVAYRVAVFVLLSQVLAFVGVLWPLAALAADGKSVAVFIEGGDAEAVAGEVRGALPAGLEIVDDKTFADAMRKNGAGQLGNAIAVKGGMRDKILTRVQKAMEAVGADAAIVGRVRLGKAGKEVWLVWVSADGDVKVDQAVGLRGGSSQRAADMHEALDGPAKALAPSSSSPSSGGGDAGGSGGGSGGGGGDTGGGDQGDKDKDKEPEKPKGARTPHNLGTSIFSLAAAFEVGGRLVAFTDPITLNIRPYQVLGAPMIHVGGEVYPAATSGIVVLKDIGLTGRFSMALGLSSATENGSASTGNTWIRFRGGLKWRFLPGSDKGPILALTGDFGMDVFSFDNAGDLAGSVPSVEYQYLRAGGEVRVPIGPVAFELGGGYRGLLGIGETGTRFTNPQALAFDAFAGFAVTLPAGFELRLAAEYTRVVYSFTPELGDGYVAGGMVDEMLGARAGVAYVY